MMSQMSTCFLDVFKSILKLSSIILFWASFQLEATEPRLDKRTDFVQATIQNVNKRYREAGGRITGGRAAPFKAYPFFARVLTREKFLCGGTILSQYEILTAAHCVYDNNEWNKPEEIEVTTGDFTSGLDDGSSQLHNLQSYQIFPQYTNVADGFDVVILITKYPIIFDEYRKPFPNICRDEDSPTIGNRLLKAIGLGLVEDRARYQVTASRLMEVDLTEVSPSECRYAFDSEADEGSIVCLKTEGGKDTCSGDSGGPIFEVDKSGRPVCLYAITSFGAFGFHCGSGLPAMYARLSHYMPRFRYESQIISQSKMASSSYLLVVWIATLARYAKIIY